MNKKEKEEIPEMQFFKDYRYILNTLIWDNKEIDFPVELYCAHDDKVLINNCDFKKGLVIRLDDGVQIDNIHIYNSNIEEGLKILAHNAGKSINDVSIDTCSLDKLEIIGLSAPVDIYKSKISNFLLESNNFSKLKIERSHVTRFTCYFTRALKVDISKGTFSSGGVLPKKVFSDFKKRYKNKEDAQDATVQTLDFLLENSSTSLCTSEYSEILYYRNKAQIKSPLHHCLLWLFGYFNDLSRYLTTAIIFLSSVFFSLMAASIINNTFLSPVELARLSIDSFIGLSNTYGYNEHHLISIVLSCSIGLGTIFYSGLLVTLINRFRIRF
ncbi:hypothetical protein M2H60_21610 [Vibrio vulnificus]|nr:hypothetical protein [Vibrio vulnificus]